MENALEKEIIAEAKLRLRKYEERLGFRRKYLERVRKRTGVGVSSPLIEKAKNMGPPPTIQSCVLPKSRAFLGKVNY